jgi:hypothetical protein
MTTLAHDRPPTNDVVFVDGALPIYLPLGVATCLSCEWRGERDESGQHARSTAHPVVTRLATPQEPE